jgi:hypothetical protein
MKARQQGLSLSTEEQRELEFLRYFYGAAGDVFGPADDDCYQGIKDDYERQGGKLPKTYKREE